MSEAIKVSRGAAALLRHDRRTFENRLRNAARSVDSAERAYWLWADAVRACVEPRYEGSTDDQAILNDPLYGAVLDLGGMFREVREQLSKIRGDYERLTDELARVRLTDGTTLPCHERRQW
jgi:hypothetical protein